jgi:hypothetical protein
VRSFLVYVLKRNTAACNVDLFPAYSNVQQPVFSGRYAADLLHAESGYIVQHATFGSEECVMLHARV